MSRRTPRVRVSDHLKPDPDWTLPAQSRVTCPECKGDAKTYENRDGEWAHWLCGECKGRGTIPRPGGAS